MSLSYGSVVHEGRANGSALVIVGMVATALFCLVLSTALGVGPTGAEAMFVGP